MTAIAARLAAAIGTAWARFAAQDAGTEAVALMDPDLRKEVGLPHQGPAPQASGSLASGWLH